MRARKLHAYVFDFDDTLAKDTAKSYLYRDGKFVKSMTADEYHHHIKQPNERFDFSEFDTPKKINAKLGPAWNLFNNLYEKGEDLFILTARQISARTAIYDFILSNGACVPFDNIHCIGGPSVLSSDIPRFKHMELDKYIKPFYKHITLFDDNDLTINRLKNKDWITPILIEDI